MCIDINIYSRNSSQNFQWVGNAVGALNHKFFVLFIFYTFLDSAISLVLIVMRFVRCGYTQSLDGNSSINLEGTITADEISMTFNTTTENGIGGTGLRFLEDAGGNNTFLYEGCESLYSSSVIGLIVISICFLVFTCCMLFEQVDAIESNTSKIARMKMRMGQDGGEYGKVALGFNEMFGVGSVGANGGHGGNIALHWFLPTPVRFPSDRERDQVLGYEFSEEWANIVYEEEDEEEAGPSPGHFSARRASGSLMISDDDHAPVIGNNGIVEIELPSGNPSRLERSNSRGGTINQRSSSKGPSLERSANNIV